MRSLRGLIVAVALCAAGRALRAQTLPLKRTPPPAPSAAACPPIARSAAPPAAQRDSARRLIVAAQEASIVGDLRNARDLLKRAAALDPSDGNIAYHLAQAQDGLHENADAVAAYCRFVALQPGAPEAAEVRARIAAIAPPPPTLTTSANAQFKVGLDQYDKRRFRESELAFTNAIGQAPTWPELYYDRALALIGQDQSADAARDLQKYLELRPEASDRSTVVNRIASLQRQALSPGTALALGVLPGGGQFYTRRPVIGALIAAGVAGGIVYAMGSSSVQQTQTFTNPFGQKYTNTFTTSKRSHVGPGLAIAGGVTALGAIEAFIFAKHSGAAEVPAAAPPRTKGFGLLLAPTPGVPNGVTIGAHIGFR